MDCIFDTGDDMIEVLKQAFADAKRNERYNNVAETRYWLNQYKLIAEKAIAELESQEPVTRYCCHSCFKTSGGVMLDRMIVCPDCGNKRCPKASNHALKCTNSNDPNQVGSIYTHPPQRTWVGLTDDEIDSHFEDHGWSPSEYYYPVIKDVEAKLKEKNSA